MYNFTIRYLSEWGRKTSLDKETEDYVLDVKEDEDGFRLVLNAKKNITLISAKVELPHFYDKGDVIFVDGYQSWTQSREYGVGESLWDIAKLPKSLLDKFSLKKYGDYEFKKYKKHVLHGYENGYIKGKDPFFISSRNAENAYLIINFDTKSNQITLESDVNGVEIKKDSSYVIFNYMTSTEIEYAKKHCFDYRPRNNPGKMWGYCSWYDLYQNINEESILHALEGTDERMDLFQIDDGYETYVGDWLDVDEKKFPNGLKGIVEKIHAKGLKAGIWMAPFVAETKSRVFIDHPEWIRKDRDGQNVIAGCNWSGYYSLDLENKEVRAYIKKCFKFMKDIGFDFFKLDFLYAASLDLPKGKSRARWNEECYKFLRECLDDKLILGCGAIPANSYRHFDYLRIGADVSLDWDDKFWMKIAHRERVSTRQTLQNTLWRQFHDGYCYGNDPDVFLLRDKNTKMSEAQKKSLVTINALCGSLFLTSDVVKDYDKEKKALLDEALKLREATDIQIDSKPNKHVRIAYSLANARHELDYNPVKGVIKNVD